MRWPFDKISPACISEFVFHFPVGDALKSVEPAKAGKWKKYLELKASFYLSYVSLLFCVTESIYRVYSSVLLTHLQATVNRGWQTS